MKRYHLAVRNGLLFTRAALRYQNLFRVVSLLIDTRRAIRLSRGELFFHLVSIQLHLQCVSP